MPDQFRNEDLVFVSCYHINGEVEGEDKIDMVVFDASQSSVTKICFFDEDLLSGSTPYNQPMFVVGYSNEQRVN